MPFERVNNARLYYEVTGSGEPMLLVHGSWDDHHNWAAVVPSLSGRFRVVTFDRRGHSQSEAPPAQGSFAEDARDLGVLVEQLGLAPAHIVGNSGGASIALRLAAQRPDVFRTLVVHEPPLLDLLRGRPEFEPMLQGFQQRVGAVIALLQAGDMEAAARQFVENIAFGPGAWETLPEPMRATFVRNAPTFLDEANDPDGLNIDLGSLKAFTKPALVSCGTDSAPFFGPIAELVAQALPRATVRSLEGAGHVPHMSHPREYVAMLSQFCQQVGA